MLPFSSISMFERAIVDKDYGPDATAPNLTTQSELRVICKEFLKSLQVTETHVA